MCADFRVKCEVEVRGLTALFLYAAYRRHAVSPVPRRGHLRKALGNIVESAVLPYPRFSVRGQSITVFTTRPDDPRQPLSFVWEERGGEQAAYEQNARTTWRFRNSYVRLL